MYSGNDGIDMKKYLIFTFLLFVSIATNAQSKTISGVVFDEDDELLPGVNIVIKGTSDGTITDLEGRFTLELQDEQNEIEISYIGYFKQTIDVNNISEVRVELQLDESQIQEVREIAYGQPKTKKFLSILKPEIVDILKSKDIYEADLVVVVCKVVYSKDTDLHIKEPTGEVCNNGNDKTKIGGQLIIDSIGVRRNEAEMYVLKKAVSGKYAIVLDYNNELVAKRAKIHIDIYRNWGRENEKVTSKVIDRTRGKWLRYSKNNKQKTVMEFEVK